MTVRKQLRKIKGDIICEAVLIERIEQAVRDIIESDVQGTIDLHNHVCQGQVAVYESEGGEPLDMEGKVLGERAENSAWTYLFTKGEDE